MYGVNSLPELMTEAVLGGFETLFLILVLRPWSYDRSWIRLTIATVCFAPWALAAGIAGMNSGSVYATHTLWRLTISAILSLILIISGIAAARRRFGANAK